MTREDFEVFDLIGLTLFWATDLTIGPVPKNGAGVR